MSRSNRSYGCLPLYVEWSIGLVILVVLAAVLWPVKGLSPARREKCYRTLCGSNLKQIALASRLYAEDCDGRLPQRTRWDENVRLYLKHEMLLRCPSDSLPDRLSYSMNPAVSGIELGSRSDEELTVGFYDGVGAVVIERHTDGANYSFLDGRVKWLADPPEDSGLFARQE